MIEVKIRPHMFKLDVNKYRLRKDKFCIVDLPDKSSVSDLLNILEIKLTGKLLLINDEAIKDENHILNDMDEIKIFRLIAGG